MPPRYVDTSHHVAVADYRDALHARALRLANELAQSPANTFITAEAVLIELLTFFSNKGPHVREQAAAYVDQLRTASPTIIIPQTPALLDAASIYSAAVVTRLTAWSTASVWSFAGSKGSAMC